MAVAVEITGYDRTLFRVQFGKLTLKAYTKGERVLRFEAVVHNTDALNCGRRLVRFPLIVARLKGMIERFLTMLDCVDTAFVADTTLDQLPLPSRVGKTRVGGVDPNKPRMRAALKAGGSSRRIFCRRFRYAGSSGNRSNPRDIRNPSGGLRSNEIAR